MLAHGVVFAKVRHRLHSRMEKGVEDLKIRSLSRMYIEKGAEWNTPLFVPTNSRIVVSMSRSQYEGKRVTSRELHHNAMPKFRAQDQRH
jgi:hypothetical protein